MPKARFPIRASNPKRPRLEVVHGPGTRPVTEPTGRFNVLQGGLEEPAVIATDLGIIVTAGAFDNPSDVGTPGEATESDVREGIGIGNPHGMSVNILRGHIGEKIQILELTYPLLSGGLNIYQLANAIKAVNDYGVLGNRSKLGPSINEKPKQEGEVNHLELGGAITYSSLDKLKKALGFFPRNPDDEMAEARLLGSLSDAFPSPIWENKAKRELMIASLDLTYKMIILNEVGLVSRLEQSAVFKAIQKNIDRLKDDIVERVIRYDKPRDKVEERDEFDIYMQELIARAISALQPGDDPEDPDAGGDDLSVA